MAAGAGEAAIEMRGLGLSLGGNLLLDDISLAIPHGAFCAILGPNGAGKTTLLKLVLGLLEPSSGELQRVYLARAIAREPALLLLDEPAAGIDAAGEHDMFHILEAYQRRTGATVLLVSHDWGAAWHHATQVLLLSRRLLASGPPREVLTDRALGEAFGHVGHGHGMGWGGPRSKVQGPRSEIPQTSASKSISTLDPGPWTLDKGAGPDA